MLRAAAVLAFVLLLACGGARASDQAAPVQPVPADKSADDTRLDLQKPEEEEPKAAESWWQAP